MQTWSLEQQLCELTGVLDFSEALYKLHLIEHPNDTLLIRRDDRWAPGGSETYLYHFWISQDNKPDRGYIIKACVPFSPGFSSEAILSKWLSRRELIAANAISTPLLVTYKKALLIEEYIPYTLKAILSTNKVQPPHAILQKLASLAGTLVRLRFRPIDAFSDLRSRGNDVVVVDFGEDLGPAGVTTTPPLDLYNLMIEQLKRWGLPLTDELVDELRTAFTLAAAA